MVNASTYDFPVLYEKVSFEIEALFRGDEEIKEGILNAAKKLEEEGVRAILLECSDLPPYAWAVQEGSGLPVYDFITLIKWVERSIAQEPYYGMI